MSSIRASLSGRDNASYYTGNSSLVSDVAVSRENRDTRKTTDDSSGSDSGSTRTAKLTDEQHKQVVELKQRDREVRTHEAAHMAAGGGVVRGGATFSYQSGPDGKRYAIGGEVGIDTAAVKGDPEATIIKMQRVRAAALAPSDPSGQDRAVAAAAAATEAAARMQMNSERQDGKSEGASRSDVGNSRDVYGKDGIKEELYYPLTPSIDLMA